MADAQLNTDRRGDSFLSSRGVDQSTVIMIGAILVVAFLLLSLLGQNTTDDLTPRTSRQPENAATVIVPDEPTADIAGSYPAAINAD